MFAAVGNARHTAFWPCTHRYETLFPRHSDLLSVALLAVLLLDRAIIGVMIHHLRYAQPTHGTHTTGPPSVP